MPRRIDLGRALLAIGSALLLASLFVEWYDNGLTAWEAFEVLDLLLLAFALAGIAVAVRPDAVPRWVATAVPAAALVVVVVQLLNDPPAAAGSDPSTGAWLALGGSALMLAGAAMALARISVTVQVAEREIRHRVPAVDRRDAGGAATASDRPVSFAEPVDDDEAAADGEVRERTQPLRALPTEDDGEEPTRS